MAPKLTEYDGVVFDNSNSSSHAQSQSHSQSNSNDEHHHHQHRLHHQHQHQQRQHDNPNQVASNSNSNSNSSNVSSGPDPSDDSDAASESSSSSNSSTTGSTTGNASTRTGNANTTRTTTTTTTSTDATLLEPLCDISTLLTKELMELSFNDRNEINEEVHGVNCMATLETPELLLTALNEFQYELNNNNNNIPIEQKYAYNIATGKDNILVDSATTTTSGGGGGGFDSSQPSSNSNSNSSSSSSYVTSHKFQLRFLRAELFNIKKAVLRMCTYLNLIYKLFGINVLKRPLRITDFNNNDDGNGGDKSNIILRSGLVQLLPYRDRSGRRVMVILSDIMAHNHIMRVKIFLYLLTVASEDVDTQKNGCLFVMWPGKSTNIRLPKNEERIICRKSFSAFPLRVVGMHFCWPDTPLFHFIKSFFILVIGQDIRARVNFHTGERQEIQYQLMGYGIPTQALPTTESGQIKTKNHTQWYKTRVMLEKQAELAASCSSTSSPSYGSDPSSTTSYTNNSDPLEPGECYGAIECPRLNDVLYERTKPCMFHPGNTLFKGLIEEKKTDHAKLTQTAKRDFTWSIVEEVERRGGRFLKWDQRGFWIPIANRSEIRLKVATSLRDFNKHTRALNKCQTTSAVSCVAFDNKTQDYTHDIKKRRVMISDDELSVNNNNNNYNECGGAYNSLRGICIPLPVTLALSTMLFDHQQHQQE